MECATNRAARDRLVSLVHLIYLVCLVEPDQPSPVSPISRVSLDYPGSNCEKLFAAGCSKSPSSKAAGESKPEAYPLGYVEDFDEPRTKLADFFSILCFRGGRVFGGNLCLSQGSVWQEAVPVPAAIVRHISR